MLLRVVGQIEIYDKRAVNKKDLRQNEDIYGLQYLGKNQKYYFGGPRPPMYKSRPELIAR